MVDRELGRVVLPIHRPMFVLCGGDNELKVLINKCICIDCRNEAGNMI